MPLPMVHLAVAVELHGGAIPTPAFLLGSLAPDAIHMRAGAGRDEKRQTHLPSVPEEPDDRLVRRLFLGFAGDGGARADFAAGYAAHILTDRRWSQTVYPRFLSRVPPDLDPDTLRRVYYRDVDQLDCDLYARAAWRPAVWAQLSLAQADDFAGLLTGDEIERWRDRTVHWFTAKAGAPAVTPAFCTADEIGVFVVETAEAIAGRFATWRAASAAEPRATRTDAVN